MITKKIRFEIEIQIPEIKAEVVETIELDPKTLVEAVKAKADQPKAPAPAPVAK